MFALIFICANAFAGDGNKIKVISGDKNLLNDVATALFVIDYDGTRWEEDDDYKDWCGKDYDERVKISVEAFKSSFNSVSNGLKITENDDAKYKIVFKISNLEQHQGFKAAWGQQYMAISGTISIIEISSNKTVCCFEVLKLKGTVDYAVSDRIKKAFSNVPTVLFDSKKVK